MNITVIGTGNIGGTVGRFLASAGHHVTFGSRHPEDESAAEGTTASVAPIAAALAASEVLVVAIPGEAVDGFVAENAAELEGKLIIDASNRMGAPVMNSAETYRAAAPAARYARGFNGVGVECLIDPLFDGVPSDLFYSSPASDQSTVEEVMACSGLRPICVGEDPNVVDGVCRLWIALVYGQGHNRELAFRTLERR